MQNVNIYDNLRLRNSYKFYFDGTISAVLKHLLKVFRFKVYHLRTMTSIEDKPTLLHVINFGSKVYIFVVGVYFSKCTAHLLASNLII